MTPNTRLRKVAKEKSPKIIRVEIWSLEKEVNIGPKIQAFQEGR